MKHLQSQLDSPLLVSIASKTTSSSKLNFLKDSTSITSISSISKTLFLILSILLSHLRSFEEKYFGLMLFFECLNCLTIISFIS